MPTINIDEDDKSLVEQLRKEMPLLDGKVPSAKTTVSLVLEFVKENKANFVIWLDKRSGQKR